MSDLNPLDRVAAALADRYRFVRELGQGGMATVYLAQDLRHERKVAIKVLRAELAAVLGADRFVQEIRTTANLQHPNILPLFDSGEAGGYLYYVMPYVEGESLRQRLNRETQLGIEDAVRIARDVAEALDYAHRQNVVHRDIKPENILLHDGRTMVLDFGIALAVSAAGGSRMTETGLSLGTPHYMSPEQATADKHVTHRSDIYSLGCVLYEMLTGEPPHTGSSAQAIILKIVTDVVRPVTDLRKAVPPNVAAATAKALQKLSADRFESAKAFADALGNPAFTFVTSSTLARSAGPPARRSVPMVVMAASLVVLVALAAWGWLRPMPPRPVVRQIVTLGEGAPLSGLDLRTNLGIAPDGSMIVYRETRDGRTQLYLKRRDALVAQPLAGTEDARGPFFSPDGAWIGFFARGELRKMPSAGGGAVTLADSVAPGPFAFGTWLDDGTIVFNDLEYRLRRVDAGGGPAEVVVGRESLHGQAAYLPWPLPRGRGVVFTTCSRNCEQSAAYVYDARADSARLLVDEARGVWYAPTGHILYVNRDGTLLAAPWDRDGLRIAGPALPILSGLQSPGLTFSAEGTALYVLGPPLYQSGPPPNAEVVWVDRTGRVEPVDPGWRFNTGGLWGLALSADGRRLAIVLETALGLDVWVKHLPAGPLSRLTFYEGDDWGPRWTPDGRSITFVSNRPTPRDTAPNLLEYNVWTHAADGTGDPVLVWDHARSVGEAVWSHDGQWLVLRTAGPPRLGERDILAVRPGTDSVARALLASPPDEQSPALSPNGQWLAYVSNETGIEEVYVRPFPDVGRNKWPVSSGGGGAPVWAHNGRELFYWGRGKLNVVQIDPGPPFTMTKPHALFARPERVREGSARVGLFDIAPDDRRFLMVRDVPLGDVGSPPMLVMVQNFFEELRAKVRK